MYKIIYFISAFIRGCLLPNPYVNLIGNETWAELFNIVIGGLILHKLSYWFTGIIYRKSVVDPSVGSFCYLISYVVITLVISCLGYFISNSVLFIIIFCFLYLVICLIAGKVFSKGVF